MEIVLLPPSPSPVSLSLSPRRLPGGEEEAAPCSEQTPPCRDRPFLSPAKEFRGGRKKSAEEAEAVKRGAGLSAARIRLTAPLSLRRAREILPASRVGPFAFNGSAAWLGPYVDLLDLYAAKQAGCSTPLGNAGRYFPARSVRKGSFASLSGAFRGCPPCVTLRRKMNGAVK